MKQVCEVVLDQTETIEIVEEDGHLFVRGVLPVDLNRLIEEEREARMNELMQCSVE